MARAQTSTRVHTVAKWNKTRALNLREKRYCRIPDADTTARLRDAGGFTPYGAWMSAGWHETGLAQVVIARRQPDGRFCAGAYLVDLCCRGVIETFWLADLTARDLTDELTVLLAEYMPLKPCTVQLAARVVRAGLRYGFELGFKPPRDFVITSRLLGSPDGETFEGESDDAEAATGRIPTGTEEGPLYIVGPDDEPASVIEALMSAPIDRFSVFNPRDYQRVRFSRRGETEAFDRELVGTGL